MLVTNAAIDDIDDLTHLLAILFEAEQELWPDHDRQRRALKLIIENPDVGRILVLRASETDPKPIAMVNLLFTVSTFCGGKAAMLEDVIVHPDHRRKGAGQTLLNAALQHARSLGCKRVTLLTDHVNHAARSFYEKHGFQRSEMVAYRKML